MNKEGAIKKNILMYFYFVQGILLLLWILYLSQYYSFYNEEYFYINKQQSAFLNLLTFFNDNWSQLLGYFIISFLLISATFFFSYSFYLHYRKKNQRKPLLLFAFYILCVSVLTLNICWPIFSIIFILAASLFYIFFASTKSNQLHYEEGDIIETKGPFETEKDASIQIEKVLEQFQKKEGLTVTEEIYLNDDKKYYADIYIESHEK